MTRTFKTRDEELEYLKQIRAELDKAATKQDVANLWNRHYLTIGHRKLGRLLLGQSPEQALRMGRGGREE